MRISDWSSDVCSSDLVCFPPTFQLPPLAHTGWAPSFERTSAFHPSEPFHSERPTIALGHERQGVDEALARLYAVRSEERRVGKECVSTCRSGWWPYHSKKKKNNIKRTTINKTNKT